MLIEKIFMVKVKKENETKRDKFVRLAENRVQRILYDLRILGNCSNTKYYEFYAGDIDQIFFEIEKKVKDTKNLFITELYRIKNKTEKFSLGK